IRAVIFALAALACAIFIRPRKLGFGACLILFTGVLIWFFSAKPSNNRDWQTDVEQVPRVEINGDTVTIHNVRNFEYRTETEYTPHWETRTYQLSALRSADIILCYWGSKNIAHGMVSFDFSGDQFLCASIETRKHLSEDYSTV